MERISAARTWRCSCSRNEKVVHGLRPAALLAQILQPGVGPFVDPEDLAGPVEHSPVAMTTALDTTRRSSRTSKAVASSPHIQERTEDSGFVFSAARRLRRSPCRSATPLIWKRRARSPTL